MAEMIKVVKPEKYENAFISMDKNAFIEFCRKTQKKNAVVLYSLLAGNVNGWGILLSANNVMDVWGIKDRNMANSITRAETIDELKRLNYINNRNEFNERGWGEKEEIKEEPKPVKVITLPKKEQNNGGIAEAWGL